MVAERGQEWNTSYVFPQYKDKPPCMVKPMSFQINWTQSPPFLCAASETAWDVTMDYSNTQLGSFLEPKFIDEKGGDTGRDTVLSDIASHPKVLCYMLEEFMDDFCSLAIPMKCKWACSHDVFTLQEIGNKIQLSTRHEEGWGMLCCWKGYVGFSVWW